MALTNAREVNNFAISVCADGRVPWHVRGEYSGDPPQMYDLTGGGFLYDPKTKRWYRHKKQQPHREYVKMTLRREGRGSFVDHVESLLRAFQRVDVPDYHSDEQEYLSAVTKWLSIFNTFPKAYPEAVKIWVGKKMSR